MVIELHSMSFSIEIFSYCNPVDSQQQHSHIYANTTRATPMLQCSHLFRTDRQLDDKHTGLEAHNCDWWIFRSSNADSQIYGGFRCEWTMMVLMAFTVYPQLTSWWPGSVIAAAGLGLSAFAPNVIFLYFSAGVLIGPLLLMKLICSFYVYVSFLGSNNCISSVCSSPTNHLTPTFCEYCFQMVLFVGLGLAIIYFITTILFILLLFF